MNTLLDIALSFLLTIAGTLALFLGGYAIYSIVQVFGLWSITGLMAFCVLWAGIYKTIS